MKKTIIIVPTRIVFRLRIVDSVKEIIIELIKRTLPVNPQIEQK